jgi:hypothetical protein
MALRGFIIKSIIVFIIVLIALTLYSTTFNKESTNVREPKFAGSWYPETKAQLNSTLEILFQDTKQTENNVKALIVPHAGYKYSGQTAAIAYAQLEKEYNNIFILAPSHQYPLKEISILNITHYKTPLGKVKLSPTIQQMRSESIIHEIPEAHEKEHSIELQIPFLQSKIKNPTIIPMLVGQMDHTILKQTILKYHTDEDLIVVSVDLSHFHNQDEAQTLDAYALNKIKHLNTDDIYKAEIDAPYAVATLLEIAKEKKWKPIILQYTNSGEITKDKSSVVGYSAIAFIDTITKDDQKLLLRIARDTLEKNYLDKLTYNYKIPNILKKKYGCFVTLNKDKDLRGCIGTIEAKEPLHECIKRNTINAAKNDKRFEPITTEEINQLEIEISILTPPKPVHFTTTQELIDQIKTNDGVILEKGLKRSTFLPQVWENFETKEGFLKSLCEKAKLESDCYKNTQTKIFTYQAEVFSES